MHSNIDAALRFLNLVVLHRVGLTLTQYRKDVAFLTNKRAMRLLYLTRRYREIEDVEGDLVECGVGHGRSLLMLAYLMKYESKKRTLWGFDTFRGFPAPTDGDDLNRDIVGKHAVGIDAVWAMLESSGIGDSFLSERIRLVPGRVEHTLANYAGGPIALLHIDLDLYDGYKATLETLYDKVVRGGLVLFDEYLDPRSVDKWPGPKRAIAEFFGEDVAKMRRDPIYEKYYWVKP